MKWFWAILTLNTTACTAFLLGQAIGAKMEIGIVLVEALVAGAVAALIYQLIVGWNTRAWVALWLALSLIAWVGLAGPLRLG